MQTEQVLQPINETGFRGMHSNPDVPVPTGYVSDAKNFWLRGLVYTFRPGLSLAGPGALAAAKASVVHFQELDGTLHTVAFCNADLFEYDWSTNTWSSLDLATKSVTLDASSVLHWAVSRGRLIITDGVNKPVMWNPAADTWTTLTAAPIAGGVTIYYDKTTFYDLPGGNGAVFEWSDEGDPTLGYAADNQDWEFVQTDGGAITLIVGMNDVLPIAKEDSFAKLSGAMEDTFQTDAVREGISETEGAAGKFGAVVYDGDLFYLSKLGPRMLRKGVQRIEIDKDGDGNNMLKGVWETFDKAEIGNAVGFLDKDRHLIVWLIPLVGETTRYSGIAYAIDSGTFSRIEFDTLLPDVVSATQAEDPDGNEWVLLGCADGKVYIWGDDTADDAGSNFTARLRSRQYGRSLGVVHKRLVEVALGLNVPANNFEGQMRPFADNRPAANFEAAVKPVRVTTARDNHQYRRGFNQTGATVGWDFEATAHGGRCEVLSAVTQLTTVANTSHRG